MAGLCAAGESESALYPQRRVSVREREWDHCSCYYNRYRDDNPVTNLCVRIPTTTTTTTTTSTTLSTLAPPLSAPHSLQIRL